MFEEKAGALAGKIWEALNEGGELTGKELKMRDTTERPEGIAAGTLKLVGTNEEVIYSAFKKLIEDKNEYDKMSKASNPYGDGHACERIADILEEKL